MAERDEEQVEIEHEKVIDGFGHLVGHKYYRAFPSTCSICGRSLVLSASDQKYLLEVKGVPVKLMQYAAFCMQCRSHRARIKFLKRETGSRGNPELKPLRPSTFAELPFLRQEGQAGPLWVRHIEHSRLRHVGAIPVGSAGEADMSLLGLIGLCPQLCPIGPRRLLYLDTETTGLGGAGTLAFLVGLAYFDEKRGFALRAALPRQPRERACSFGSRRAARG